VSIVVFQKGLEITVRLSGALTAGALISLERSYKGRPAGFRTHAMVRLDRAADAFNLLRGRVVSAFERRMTTLDATRTAQEIMTGAGFLGAGKIEAKVTTLFYAGIAVRFASRPLRRRRASSLSRMESPSQTSTIGVQATQRRRDLVDGGIGQIPPQELRTHARQ
jgi:MgtC family